MKDEGCPENDAGQVSGVEREGSTRRVAVGPRMETKMVI